MPSITSWTRLEPRSRDQELAAGLEARIYDPLWFLARQWQLGEFRGEDSGSPVSVRARLEQAPLTRFRPGPAAAGVSAELYDGDRLPLETVVEREVIERGSVGRDRRRAASAGLHFLRLLEHHGASAYRRAYLEHYALEPPSAEDEENLDRESLSYLRVMAHRTPDGDRLYADLHAALGAPGAALPATPAVAADDRDQVTRAAEAWLEWSRTFYSEGDAERSTWVSERMEYAFALAANSAEQEVVLEAPEYVEGHLDWHAFDLDPGASLGTGADDPRPARVTRTVIPAPVTYSGMPASRWWEFEDAQVDFGAVEAGPADLVRLLFLEFALVYGDDWFLIPVELDVGAVYRIDSLVVTDVFGERRLIRPYHVLDGSDSPWRLFCPAVSPDAAERGSPESLLVLPGVLGTSLQGRPLEEVLLLRDEMANMGWAVERRVAGAVGRGIDRVELAQVKRRRRPETPPSAPETPVVYRLATEVPEHWIPLVPVSPPGEGSPRLARGRLLVDGAAGPVVPAAQGRLLEPERPLALYEEEVPRAGAAVTRAWQYARWCDGSTHLWIGRRKGPGRGEGSSGLRFDVAEETGVAADVAAGVDHLRAGGLFGSSKFDQEDGFTDED